jgi:hypothetical protein
MEDNNVLVISLVNGEVVEIPDLTPETLELIFSSHHIYLEQEITREQNAKSNVPNGKLPSIFSALAFGTENDLEKSPFQIGFSTMDGFGSMMQHNPAQSNSPDIPKEILQKISAITKIIAPDDSAVLPRAEPHCNCPYCQIARAVGNETLPPQKDEILDLPVNDQDLKFQQWDIHQEGDKLYTVTNRLDAHEKYNVYLGQPIGCTCGTTNCEHIVAVLKS